MRPEVVLVLAAFAGASLVAAGYSDEARRGADFQVRHAWMDVVPQLCALAAAAGLALARARPSRAVAGLALANAALAAMLAHLTFILSVTLAPFEEPSARAVAALDVAALLVVALATLLLARRPLATRAQRIAAQAVAVVAALVSVRQVARVPADPSALRVVGAGIALVAMLTCVRLARFRSPTRR